MAGKAKPIYLIGVASGLVTIQPCVLISISVAVIALVLGAIIILASNRCSQNLIRILGTTRRRRPAR